MENKENLASESQTLILFAAKNPKLFDTSGL